MASRMDRNSGANDGWNAGNTGLAGVKGLYEKRGWFYFQPPTPKGTGPRPKPIALRTRDLITALKDLQEKQMEVTIKAAVRAGTLEEVLPSYYAARSGDTKPTRLARKVVLESFKDALGNPRVDQITSKMIHGWREVLATTGGKRGKPCSSATLRSYTITVRAFLKWACVSGIIRVHPLAKMERNMRVTTSRVQGFLTEDEREALLAVESEGYVKLILMLGFLAGLRYGEMLAANPKWLWFSDDGERGTLTVQATPIQFTDGKTAVWIPKGKRKRVIPLHPRLLALLKEQGVKSPWLLAPNKTLWPGDKKNSLRFDAKKALMTTGKKAGVPKLTYHMMRHSFATHLAMKGVPLAEIAGLLGDSLKVTEDHYAGFCPSKVNPLSVL